MSGVLHLLGNVRVTYVDLGTGAQRSWTHCNTITSGGLALMTQYLATPDPSAAPMGPSFLSVGVSNLLPIQPTFFTQSVPGEYFRSPVAQRDSSGLSAIFHTYVSAANANTAPGSILIAAEANGLLGGVAALLSATQGAGIPIGYLGLYGGLATDVLGTGTLIACASGIPFTKNTTNTFNVDWTLTISGKL